MEKILETLSKLQGTWKGKGEGKFPTIDSFEYEEHLHFDADLSYPLIHYEQKTFLMPTGDPSHWESGFIRLLDNGIIEISNSQDTGRVEVLHGTMKIQSANKNEYEMDFSSVVLGNDPRLINTKRMIRVSGDILQYDNAMTTNTTEKSIMLPHLHSTLQKIK